MSSIQDIDPAEPLLWINERPLLTLVYLWHLSQEDLSGSGRVDLLWKLTKQLLIAVHQKENYPIPPQEMDLMLVELEKDNVVSSLLKSHVITKEILSSILENQEIDFRHRQNVIKKMQQKLEENDEEIRQYYENDKTLYTSETYDVYEYIGEQDIKSLSSQDLENLSLEEFHYFASLSQDEIDKLSPGLEKEHLPKIAPHTDKPGSLLVIREFHSKAHKAPYEVVKPRLIEIFADTLADQEIEEEAQTYLEKTPLRYNEEGLERALQISDMWQ